MVPGKERGAWLMQDFSNTSGTFRVKNVSDAKTTRMPSLPRRRRLSLSSPVLYVAAAAVRLLLPILPFPAAEACSSSVKCYAPDLTGGYKETETDPKGAACKVCMYSEYLFPPP